jgi:uncharacterized protein YutD
MEKSMNKVTIKGATFTDEEMKKVVPYTQGIQDMFLDLLRMSLPHWANDQDLTVEQTKYLADSIKELIEQTCKSGIFYFEIKKEHRETEHLIAEQKRVREMLADW